jgi:hypothetical protein
MASMMNDQSARLAKALETIKRLNAEIQRLRDNRDLSAKYLRAAQIAAYRSPGDAAPEPVDWKELSGEDT